MNLMEKEKKITVLHLCATHILKAIRESLKDQAKDRALRELSLRLFAIIVDTTYLKSALHVWQIWCIVFMNEHATKRVNEAVEEMNELIKKASVDEDWDKLLICDGWQPKG